MSYPTLQYKAGDVYNKLTLTGKAYRNPNTSRLYIECICECGNVGFKRADEVIGMKLKSCGCIMKPHGMASYKNKIYSAWMNVKNRCYQKSHNSYPDYGGKGVEMCEEWRNDFRVFHEWSLANGWQLGLSLDRKENSKGYNPENCRWATNEEQSRNRTDNLFVTAFGETKCVQDWNKDPRVKVRYNTIVRRIFELGWDSEKALTWGSLNSGVNRTVRKNQIFLEFEGEKRSLKDWCEKLSISYNAAAKRIYRGLPVEKVLRNKTKAL